MAADGVADRLGTCPECGGHELRPVGPQGLRHGHSRAFPGALECRRCGTVVVYGD